MTHKIREKFGLGKRKITREAQLLWILSFLFCVLAIRLFYLQVIQAREYSDAITAQHFNAIDIKARRGNIYVTDAGSKSIALTQNVEVYNLFVDPKFIRDKPRVIDILAPVLHTHLCKQNGLNEVDTLGCIQNIERFAQIQILPTPKVVFYTREELGDSYGNTTGINLMQQEIIEENSVIDQERRMIINSFSGEQAMNLIKGTLDNKISIGVKEKNYLGYFENDPFLAEFSGLDLPYVSIESKHYVYIIPGRVSNIVTARQEISAILKKYGYSYADSQINALFTQQENRYVKLGDGLNATLAKRINDLINENYEIKSTCE